MAIHTAAGQMLGYLYQVRCALCMLLDSDDPSYQISLEKFDDITFERDGSPVQLIQVKHHTKPASLTDTSTDLWRTLNVWVDEIKNDCSLLEHTDFVIITTANAPCNSAAELIQQNKYEGAFEKLKAVLERPINQSNMQFYQKCKGLDGQTFLKLIKRIKIISSASNIVDIEKSIYKQIRYSCRPEHISIAIERIEGWWLQECIKALASIRPIITTQLQLHEKVYEITRQYGDDNLPIEFWDLNEIEEVELAPKERLFVEQLRLLQFHSKTLRIALQDYYKASKQRSSWLRQGLVYANELDTYEHRLKDAWEHAFAEMKESFEDYDNPTEQEKIQGGKELYHRVMSQDIKIRPSVTASYVMQGTYHHLANSLTIGWRADFFEKLKVLLDGGSRQ